MKLSPNERETIIRWSKDPEEGLTIYTHDERQAKKLIRAGAKEVEMSFDGNKTLSWTLSAPVEWFRWPRKPTKRPSAGNSAALAAARMAKKNQIPAKQPEIRPEMLWGSPEGRPRRG